MPKRVKQIVEINYETAVLEAERMNPHQTYRTQSTSATVHTGTHPDWGDVHIVIPPMGNPLILPVVLQYAEA